MQPKLIAAGPRILTPLGQYVPSKFSGKNVSGILPIGDRVLVLPDKAPEKSAGGIEFTQTQQDRDGLAAETGVLVAIGDAAWTWNSDRSRPFSGTKPKVGQRVWFERYAGSVQFGADGVAYRLMDDKCVGAIAE